MLLHMAGLPQSMWGEALRHSTWLKNRTSMRGLGGKTPWQVLYRTPPDLSRLKHFGEAVWVHDPDGSKLDLRAREGRWISFDVKSRGHHVYWSASRSVGIEWNMYFTTAGLKGEKLDIPTSKALPNELCATPLPLPAPLPPVPPPPTQPVSAPTPPSPPSLLSSLSSLNEVEVMLPEPQPVRSTCLRKPSCKIQELQAGVGVAST